LLDWTEGVLIALYFAVVPVDDRDGTVWALNPNALNRDQTGHAGVFLPNVTEIAGLFTRAFSGEAPSGPKVAAIWPHEMDLRILLQQSRFTIHDTQDPLEELARDRSIVRSFNIPGSCKEQIAVQLEALGFRESLLFPDLNTLAREVAGLRFREE
jgi:hypothetical protein